MDLEELDRTVIPFGKHKGKRFGEVPLSYLDWLSGQDWVLDPLRRKLLAYLGHPSIEREMGREGI